MATITRNYGDDPNYVRSSLSPGVPSKKVSGFRHTEHVEQNATLGQNELSVEEEDYLQPRELWNRVFDENERRQWVENVAETLEQLPVGLRQAVADMFSKVDSRIGQMLAAKASNSSRL